MASERTLRLRRIKDKVSMSEAYPYITGETVHFFQDTPRQVRCLIHGQDLHPSARIYPDTGLFYCHGCKLSLDAIGYYINYHGFEFSDSHEVYKMIEDLENEFGLDSYSLEEFEKDSDEESVQAQVDYKYEFKKLWIETNNLACEIKVESKDAIFDYLDQAWGVAFGPDQKFRKGWQFLFKLRETFKEEFDSCS